MTFPDPTSTQSVGAAGGGGHGAVNYEKKATMQCLFFYFPYVGKETRPRPKKRKDNTALRDIKGGTGWTTENPINLVTDDDHVLIDDLDFEVDDTDANAIDIFWVNRLVPETKLNHLPLLPNLKTRGDCDANKISEKWRDRIKGFVFLDHSWDSISNNKLKIQVDP